MEHKVCSRSRETGSLLKVHMGEGIKQFNVGLGQIMDCQEESDTGQEIVLVNPHFLLTSDHQVFYVIQPFFKCVSEVVKGVLRLSLEKLELA